VSKIYVIHENSAWVQPLQAAFRELDLPFEEWFLDEGTLDLSVPPPEGVFYIQRFQHFIAENGIEIAGIEFIVDVAGKFYIYDVNMNTNYNSDAEAAAGLFGMCAIARYLGQQL
jgi:hypothetical protein